MILTFQHFVNTATAGQQFVYWRGNLMRARDKFFAGEPSYHAANLIGEQVWRAYQDGLVELVQKRLGGKDLGTCAYAAIRTRKVHHHVPHKDEEGSEAAEAA